MKLHEYAAKHAAHLSRVVDSLMEFERANPDIPHTYRAQAAWLNGELPGSADWVVPTPTGLAWSETNLRLYKSGNKVA